MTSTHRIIPCLLLDGERLVKTVRFADPVYVGDPVNVLSIFNSFEVDEIVILDITAPGRGHPADPSLLRELATECFIPLAYGGGLSTVGHMTEVLAAGYEKVVLNTLIATDAQTVRQAAERLGSQAVVASVDVRGMTPSEWTVYVECGRVPTGMSPIEWAKRAESLGVGEILLTSIDREGTMAGFDLELCAAVSDAVSIPVIAHGGAGRRRQLAEPVSSSGASAVAAGSLFVFQGPNRGVLINYPSRTQVERLVGG